MINQNTNKVTSNTTATSNTFVKNAWQNNKFKVMLPLLATAMAFTISNTVLNPTRAKSDDEIKGYTLELNKNYLPSTSIFYLKSFGADVKYMRGPHSIDSPNFSGANIYAEFGTNLGSMKVDTIWGTTSTITYNKITKKDDTVTVRSTESIIDTTYPFFEPMLTYKFGITPSWAIKNSVPDDNKTGINAYANFSYNYPSMGALGNPDDRIYKLGYDYTTIKNGITTHTLSAGAQIPVNDNYTLRGDIASEFGKDETGYSVNFYVPYYIVNSKVLLLNANAGAQLYSNMSSPFLNWTNTSMASFNAGAGLMFKLGYTDSTKYSKIGAEANFNVPLRTQRNLGYDVSLYYIMNDFFKVEAYAKGLNIYPDAGKIFDSPNGLHSNWQYVSSAGLRIYVNMNDYLPVFRTN